MSKYFRTFALIFERITMITSFLSDSIEVAQAKQAVEARYGSRPDSPADFAELSLRIKQATAKDISPDTLSRLWGYKKGYEHVRSSVIEILNAYARAEEESDFVYRVAVKADDLQPGQRVRIAWLPDRTCTLEYLGDYHWRVAEVSNSKLQVGDTFSCRVMAQGQSLIVDKLITADGEYEGYAIGGKNGLTSVELV